MNTYTIRDLSLRFNIPVSTLRYYEDIIQSVSEHESVIQAKIAELQQELLHIQHKVRFYNGIKDAIDSGSPKPAWDDFSKP